MWVKCTQTHPHTTSGMQIYFELQSMNLNLCLWGFEKDLYIIEKATERYFICIDGHFILHFEIILKHKSLRFYFIYAKNAFFANAFSVKYWKVHHKTVLPSLRCPSVVKQDGISNCEQSSLQWICVMRWDADCDWVHQAQSMEWYYSYVNLIFSCSYSLLLHKAWWAWCFPWSYCPLFYTWVSQFKKLKWGVGWKTSNKKVLLVLIYLGSVSLVWL